MELKWTCVSGIYHDSKSFSFVNYHQYHMIRNEVGMYVAL